MQGTAIFYNRQRGFGFLLPDDGSNDVFVNVAELPADHKFLAEGDRVEYSIGQFNGRRVAVNVCILERAISCSGRPE